MRLLLLIVVPLALMVLLPFVYSRLFRRWERLAARLDMTLVDAGTLSGSYQGYPIQLAVSTASNTNEFRVFVDCTQTVPLSLSLRPRFALGDVFHPDVMTGDDDFDRAVLCEGNLEDVLAVLDHTARRAVQAALYHQAIRVTNGVVSVPLSDFTRPQVDDACSAALELAKHLEVPQDEIARRLARNSATDPLVSVRLMNLGALQAHFGDSDAAVAASRKALEDTDFQLRLQGALFLGEEGTATLCSMAKDHTLEPDLRVRAIEKLLPTSEATALVEWLLGSAVWQVRRAAVAAVRQFALHAALPKLVAQAEDEVAEVAEAIARTLGLIGDPGAEPALVRLLAHNDRRTVHAAINALENIGTTTAVEPLFELSHSHAPSTLKTAAQDAIASIQARLGGVEEGMLSVAQCSKLDGALSSSEEDHTGGLTLTADDETTEHS